MDINILKEVALASFNGDDIYRRNNKYYYSCDDTEVMGDNLSDDYLVLTDDEADEYVKEEIKNLVWTFKPEFIIDHTELPYESEEMIKTFQEEKCEGANETILAMIDDFDEFVRDAISADGRGHFLAHYDGEENKIEVFNTEKGIVELFYIYKIN